MDADAICWRMACLIMANENGHRLVDGQLSWIGGVNSDIPKTIQSEGYPDGIKRNQLAWLVNGHVRGGGVSQRLGWEPRVQDIPWGLVYQGGWLYQPDFGDLILLLLIDGNLWRVRLDTDNSVTNLSALYGTLADPLTMPVNAETDQAFLNQAEMFAVIQAGDLITNPLFYDFGVQGVRPESLRRSLGFIGVNNPLNEIPPATAMDYHAQRLWYAFGRNYCAGDIAQNQSSGTAAFDFRDSVIHVTENPIATGGDGFVVPTVAGNIRALNHASASDSALGQTPLYVFTRKVIYSCEAPVTRADWTASTYNNMPLQKVVLAQGGTYAERAVVPVNQDLFFPSPPNGDIRSLSVALRYFKQWGNVPLSVNENRLLAFNDRSLLRFASGIQFDNRLLQASLPVATPAGVAFRGIIPLDFDPISSLEEQKPPAWEGVLEGLNILQLFQGDFGGRERAFAAVWSDLNQSIEVWELTSDQRFDGGLDQRRVSWQVETPAYTWGNPMALKELDTIELWIDKILGTVDYTVYYRPDNWPCWIRWHAWQLCSSKDCREDFESPCSDNGYPQELFCESYRATVTLPKAKASCVPVGVPTRPSNHGYQFQIKIVIKGWCRLRGLLAYANSLWKQPYQGMGNACAFIPVETSVFPPERVLDAWLTDDNDWWSVDDDTYWKIT